jgi:ketosteroid isomerase-like protein
MRQAIYFAIFVFLSGATTEYRRIEIQPSASGTSAEEIVAAEHAWAKAAVDGDAATMASLMSDDYVEIAWEPASAKSKAGWVTTDKAAWVELVRSGREKYESVELLNIKVYVQGNLATVTGEYRQKGTNGGKDISGSGAYVNTWSKLDGHLRVINSVFP